MAKKRKKKKRLSAGQIIARILFFVFTVLLLYGVFILRDWQANNRLEDAAAASMQERSVPESTELSATPIPTVQPTPQPTPTPTPEPTPELFTLTFLGDNTLWSNNNFVYSEAGLPLTVGDDYSYPYKNTIQFTKDDEYTLTNLECTLSDQKMYSSEMFSFLCPTDYAQILVKGGVDFVTMANNHTMDFYETGRDDTLKALDAVSIPHGNENEYQIVTTPNGLKLGIYTAFCSYHPENRWDDIEAAISEMRPNADLVICMFHWGQELYYTPNSNQTDLAHKCIDAGADIVYGSHPHCLQPIEVYNGKLIMYSMGNWVFGGSTAPSDCDTAIVQVTVQRDTDGSVSYQGFKAIPCCVSSRIEDALAKHDNYNDYCPTPYEEGSEGYNRADSKLKGTFEATSQGADYSNYYASWG